MYDKYYKEFSDEVHRIMACYLFWKIINNRASQDKSIFLALNKTPLSWEVIRHSLFTTLFITLGRVFDADDDAFSVDDLLKCCIDKIDMFSFENLKKRKIADARGIEPDWLAEYIAKSYEPIAEDFQRLRSQVAIRRNIFNSIYRPIRHKLIAHTDKAYMDNADELWKKTNIDELETVIWFLYDLKETLFETYQNGKKLELRGCDPDNYFYERDFGKLLDSIKDFR